MQTRRLRLCLHRIVLFSFLFQQSFVSMAWAGKEEDDVSKQTAVVQRLRYQKTLETRSSRHAEEVHFNQQRKTVDLVFDDGSVHSISADLRPLIPWDFSEKKLHKYITAHHWFLKEIQPEVFKLASLLPLFGGGNSGSSGGEGSGGGSCDSSRQICRNSVITIGPGGTEPSSHYGNVGDNRGVWNSSRDRDSSSNNETTRNHTSHSRDPHAEIEKMRGVFDYIVEYHQSHGSKAYIDLSSEQKKKVTQKATEIYQADNNQKDTGALKIAIQEVVYDAPARHTLEWFGRDKSKGGAGQLQFRVLSKTDQERVIQQAKEIAYNWGQIPDSGTLIEAFQDVFYDGPARHTLEWFGRDQSKGGAEQKHFKNLERFPALETAIIQRAKHIAYVTKTIPNSEILKNAYREIMEEKLNYFFAYHKEHGELLYNKLHDLQEKTLVSKAYKMLLMHFDVCRQPDKSPFDQAFKTVLRLGWNPQAHSLLQSSAPLKTNTYNELVPYSEIMEIGHPLVYEDVMKPSSHFLKGYQASQDYKSIETKMLTFFVTYPESWHIPEAKGHLAVMETKSVPMKALFPIFTTLETLWQNARHWVLSSDQERGIIKEFGHFSLTVECDANDWMLSNLEKSPEITATLFAGWFAATNLLPVLLALTESVLTGNNNAPLITKFLADFSKEVQTVEHGLTTAIDTLDLDQEEKAGYASLLGISMAGVTKWKITKGIKGLKGDHKALKGALSETNTLLKSAQFHSALDKKALSRLPKELGTVKEANKDAQIGVRWQDKHADRYVRIMKGRDNAPQVSQKQDYVHIRSGGKVVLRDGRHVDKSMIKGPLSQLEEAHIPYKEWIKWKEWDKP